MSARSINGRRNRDTLCGMEIKSRTTAATAARMRASEEKLAQKLIERGWFCDRTNQRHEVPPGMIMYATNGLRETYRVVGWTDDGLPFLQGDGPTFVGHQRYLFTIGAPR